MARHLNKVSSLRTEINVMKTHPRRSLAVDSPLVYVLFRMDLHLAGKANDRRDLYMEAEVQVHPDHSVEVVWLEPQYEIIKGQQTPSILGFYEEVFRNALTGDLSVIGVK